jgi:hypothetical protein
MATSSVEVATTSIDNDGIPTTVRDTRRPYERQLAVHLILASILFSLAALYSLDIHVADSLDFNKALNWTHHYSSSAEHIFDGK